MVWHEKTGHTQLGWKHLGQQLQSDYAVALVHVQLHSCTVEI